MSFTILNSTSQKKQESIKKPTEETEDRPQSTLIEKKYVRQPNGEEYITRETTIQRNQDTGQWEKIIRETSIADESGRYIPAENIAGKSWTGLEVPIDHYEKCKNPWDDHGYRMVYLDIDGDKTEGGNVLCIECYKKNDKKQRLKMWLYWMYDPEIF